MRNAKFSVIELLEDRIAPATLLSPTTVTYTDKDGDAVLIKSSKPIFISASIADSILRFDTGSVNGSNATSQQLQTIDLTFSAFGNTTGAQLRAIASDTNLMVKTLPRLGVGNGQVDVGYIKAALIDSDNLEFFDNVDLGTVNIGGDLGRIDVGDSISDLALMTLTARSLGKTTTQDPFDNGLQSNIFGGVGSIHVTGDV
ncbi:MAG: hypothetical protein QOD99_2050, partial [Chthoniobacter sp.]|nr:hypothetical protein [Chthoniobacter sp.]